MSGTRAMTLSTLALRSALFYWRTNLAVLLGVAAAASVLAGALIVGDSVRASLRELALGRLGRTNAVVSSMGFFRVSLADDLRRTSVGTASAPLIVADGFVTHEGSRRRASGILVYGVDERFWRFNGQARDDGVYVSPALARELAIAPGDVLLTRLQRPSQIPIESLFGRKEDVGRTIRLDVTGTLAAEALGEFALRPQQTEVRAVFAPLARIQRDLDVTGKVNTVLLAGATGGDDDPLAALTLPDLGVEVATLSAADGQPATIAVGSSSGILSEPLDRAVRSAASRLGVTPLPVFTYLANSLRAGDRTVPYSLVTATDLDAVAPGLSAAAGTIVLNDWTARELDVTAGQPVALDYYLWDAVAGLQTHTATFTVGAVVPMRGFAADRRLAPEYPGITAADSLSDWDPPFPIDLSRVRQQDEDYWDAYRATPKAFIDYERGRELWQTRYGQATSLRIPVPAESDAAAAAEAVQKELRASLSPAAMGVTLTPVRAMALEAATGTTDFGEYFTYFSFFIVVSALLLVVLFFKLGVEARLRQIGVMRAAGFGLAAIRRLLLAETAVVALAGGLLGAMGATFYAWFILYGLRTWWVGAVNTTRLEVHVTPLPLLAGVAGGVVAAVLCVFVSLRAVRRLSPRALLQAQALDAVAAPDARSARRRGRIALACAALAVVLLAVGFVRREAQVGAFFGAGGALLIAGLYGLSAALRAREHALVAGRGTAALARLGFRSAAYRPARSVLSAALIATAVFIIVSIGAFRRDGGEITTDPRSGTGGYAVLAQAELPLLHDPNTAAGREALLIDGPALSRVHFSRFRLRQGQDASCLNLYRPTLPTIIAPEPGFAAMNRFSFGATLASTDEERANPWLLLDRQTDDGTVPAIADATSLQYALHLGVGDTMALDTGGPQPVTLRFVGALRDSVLQGEVIVGEQAFTRLFPEEQGYTFFLVDAPEAGTEAEVAALGESLEQELAEFGVDAVGTADRLAAYHRVENTYLSTFQALGGLGLLLGTVGIATVMFRNVLERRRELAMLRSVGFGPRSVSVVVLSEAALLLCAGMAIGIACAAVAVAPAWIERGGGQPGGGLILLLLAVAIAGMVASALATRAALRGRLLDALAAE